jgi:predicted DNA-binding transcriptional regulator AlpA
VTELELRDWLARAPAGTLVPAELLAQAIASETLPSSSSKPDDQPISWRERLWIATADTRLGVAELLEALGRTKSWLYRHTGRNSPGARIPHRKLEGELVFLAGEVRQWLLETETIVVPGRTATKADLLTLRRRQQGARADTQGVR